MAPIIELSEDYLKELNPERYARRYDLEKGLEKKLQNSDGNKKDILTMYFSISDVEGKFRLEHSKEVNDDGITYYKIEHLKNSSKGTLFYISGEFDKRAIEGIDFYLSPVCEIQNISNRRNANKIELIEPGEVYLANDQWRINPNKKVKIKLI